MKLTEFKIRYIIVFFSIKVGLFMNGLKELFSNKNYKNIIYMFIEEFSLQ